MRLWTIRAYKTGGGRDVLKEWYDAQTVTVQARFDARIEFLAQCPRPEWKREAFDLLSGGGLGEIRFKADRVQHRPIGYFGPGRMEFTILICAKEKGDRFVPRDACDIAENRKTEVENDHSRCVTCDWLWDDGDEEEV